MLDTTDNTTVPAREIAVDLVQLSSIFNNLLRNYSVRTNNVLKSLRGGFSDDASFLVTFVKMSRNEISKLKNCGRKTIQEIEEIQSILKRYDVIPIVSKPEPNRPVLPSNIDALLPMISPFTFGLTVRTKNAFSKFLEEHKNSLSELYETISDPSFKPGKVKNIGRGSVEEIRGLFDSIKGFLEGFSSEQSVVEALTGYHSKTLNDVQIPMDFQEGIHNLESTLGYFPLFAAINAYFEGLDGDDRIIIEGCINMHVGQTLPDRADVAAELNVTPERIRQKRNKLVESLESYFASYRLNGFVDKCPYDYQMRRINEEINATEGTDFNLCFVNWVLSSTFEEVTALGDVIKTITGYYDKNYFLCLVPTELCQYMDFSAFLEDVETRLAEKRINEERGSLQKLINDHLKTQYCEDKIPAIETTCRSILYLYYPVDVDFGQVIFKPNARKNNPIIIEEIIRAAGHPLTLEEIYEEFIYQYPERYTEMNSLRGSVNVNPNIIPIGRSSTYTLAEWEGENHRGGSIRQIVADYLRELDPTIAPMEDITKHVCRFRPTTDEYSILTNLYLEQTGMFSFFFREGIRYVGLSENTYSIEYFPYSGDARNATAMSIGYPRLVAFIETNGHFPFSGGVDDDEFQLWKFWKRQERYFKDGELNSSGLAYHTKILSEFGHLQMDKKEYEWRKKYALAWRVYVEKDTSGLDQQAIEELARFFVNMQHDYRYYSGSMPQWKKEAVEELMKKISEKDNVQDNLG